MLGIDVRIDAVAEIGYVALHAELLQHLFGKLGQLVLSFLFYHTKQKHANIFGKRQTEQKKSIFSSLTLSA